MANSKPCSNDENWTEYVLSLLYEKEKVEDENGQILPKVSGLRRLTNLLTDGILRSEPVQVIPDRSKCTVVYRIELKNGEVYADVGDCTELNCKPPFNTFAGPIAATRAEARALRKLLKLNVISAEEQMVGDTAVEEAPSDELISKNQITFLNDKCKELDINVISFMIDSIDVLGESDITKVKKTNASKFLQKLHTYLNGEAVPAKLIGYKANWRSE